LVAVTGLAITALVLMHPADAPTPKHAVQNSGSGDKKTQVEQAKKNSILRRFISYYDVKKTFY